MVAAAKLAEATKVAAAAKAADDERLAKLLEQANADEGLVLSSLDTDTGRTFSEPTLLGDLVTAEVAKVATAEATTKVAGRRQRG